MSRKDLDRLQVFFAMAAVLYAIFIAESGIVHAIDGTKPGPKLLHIAIACMSVVAVAALVVFRGSEEPPR